MLWILMRYSRDAVTVGEGRVFTSLTAWRNASYRNQLGFLWQRRKASCTSWQRNRTWSCHMRCWRIGSVRYAWTCCTSLVSTLVAMFSASGEALCKRSGSLTVCIERCNACSDFPQAIATFKKHTETCFCLLTGVCIGPWILSRPPSALCAVVNMPTFLRSDLWLPLDGHGLLCCHALNCELF